MEVVVSRSSENQPTAETEALRCLDSRKSDGSSIADCCGLCGGMKKQVGETRFALAGCGKTLLAYCSIIWALAVLKLLFGDHCIFLVVPGYGEIFGFWFPKCCVFTMVTRHGDGDGSENIHDEFVGGQRDVQSQ